MGCNEKFWLCLYSIYLFFIECVSPANQIATLGYVSRTNHITAFGYLPACFFGSLTHTPNNLHSITFLENNVRSPIRHTRSFHYIDITQFVFPLSNSILPHQPSPYYVSFPCKKNLHFIMFSICIVQPY